MGSVKLFLIRAARRMRARIVVATCAVVLLCLMALFVWPTRYRYERLGTARPRLLRIDRVTGTASALTDSGWTVLRPPADPYAAVTAP